MCIRDRDVAGRAPLLVAQHGGGGCPEAICDFDTRVNYRGFGPEAVRRGYIVWAPLVLMQVTYGGDPEPKTDRRYLDRRARLVGTSIVGIEVHKIMAGVRALRDAREEIDGRRIGMTGLSYGGYYTLYAHAAEIFVSPGELIEQGQVIATVGNTGSVSGSSLHFEIRKGTMALNPLRWLR